MFPYWKGDFEGMRHHLRLQNCDMMLVGDIETKWLRFKTALLEFVEKMRPLAKPWLSGHMVSMQKQKKKLFKKMLAYAFPGALGLLQKP